ncbi:hypothetical protein MIB92_03215 [Aestuariirhabdus sp. Z084]|uniref:hypothetical protein n=1 Tax=Aestuariirhabdus haliotis TaxID=2918751 RepID=UPI00201B3E42|nr:hypothetical protein [Aestuariirhabdus haliotis]MCL6414650.1 hypothetical protein [Aestuariirhabdus haliotis]MCL6418368.1 hypothetical protein [Aestuariirhabdus haliotis]
MTSWLIAVLMFSLGIYCLLPRVWIRSKPLLALVLVTIVSVIPIWQGFSIIDFLRGGFGDLSILSLSLLLLGTAARLGAPEVLGAEQKKWLMLSVVVIALPFYAATMGLAYLDPYRWGYTFQLALALLPVTLLAVWWRVWWLAISLTLAVFLWGNGAILESTNLWDYVLDPLLVIYALGYLLCYGAARGWSLIKRTG